jgi:pyruvate/2-oxoglutarate dehydrogenase complex dihydrolipoamide acyltransferase (E2) component
MPSNEIVEDIVIPQVGESSDEEVIIVKWKKGVGDHVVKGDLLLEIETGKGSMELESAYEGDLIEIIADEGETVHALSPVGRIRIDRES